MNTIGNPQNSTLVSEIMENMVNLLEEGYGDVDCKKEYQYIPNAKGDILVTVLVGLGTNAIFELLKQAIRASWDYFHREANTSVVTINGKSYTVEELKEIIYIDGEHKTNE